MTQAFGVKYPIVIPSLTENADIQTALKVYHYGQATEPSTLNANSVSGHLSNLETTKVDVIPEQIVSGASNNLNLKVTTGYYSVSTNAIASAGSFYPAGASAGMLHVINDGSGIIYQTYITNATKFYWRGYFAGAWTSWKEASDTTHTHTEFTSLAGQIATKQNTVTGGATTILDTDLDTNKVLVSDGSGKVRASADITTTELGNLNGTTGRVPSLAGTVGGDGTSKRIFIQSVEPNTTNNPGFVGQPGDLWFW